MKLLDDIVDLLMDESASLTGALLKTKVLLHQIGQSELASWVNNELNGYGIDDELPSYRALTGRLMGNITNGHYTYNNRALATSHLTDKQVASFEAGDMRQCLSALDALVSSVTANKGSLRREHAPELFGHLSTPYTGGYHVQDAWSQIEVTQVRQILIVVRSRLLDFVLELRTKVGNAASDENIVERTINLNIPEMFGKAVFGNNTTILVGNHNHQQVSITSVKHDRTALVAELKRHDVGDEDIQSLEAAIDSDPVPATTDQYGPAVRGWMSRMMGKAVDTSWNISLAAAGGVLTTVLQRYYGI